MIDDGASAGRSSPLSSATPRRRPPEVLTEAEAVALIRAGVFGPGADGGAKPR